MTGAGTIADNRPGESPGLFDWPSRKGWVMYLAFALGLGAATGAATAVARLILGPVLTSRSAEDIAIYVVAFGFPVVVNICGLVAMVRWKRQQAERTAADGRSPVEQGGSHEDRYDRRNVFREFVLSTIGGVVAMAALAAATKLFESLLSLEILSTGGILAVGMLFFGAAEFFRSLTARHQQRSSTRAE
jgi:hypothetical protein